MISSGCMDTILLLLLAHGTVRVTRVCASLLFTTTSPSTLQTLPRSPGWTSIVTTHLLSSPSSTTSDALANDYAYTHALPDAQAQAFNAYASDESGVDLLGIDDPDLLAP